MPWKVCDVKRSKSCFTASHWVLHKCRGKHEGADKSAWAQGSRDPPPPLQCPLTNPTPADSVISRLALSMPVSSNEQTRPLSSELTWQDRPTLNNVCVQNAEGIQQ